MSEGFGVAGNKVDFGGKRFPKVIGHLRMPKIKICYHLKLLYYKTWCHMGANRPFKATLSFLSQGNKPIRINFCFSLFLVEITLWFFYFTQYALIRAGTGLGPSPW